MMTHASDLGTQEVEEGELWVKGCGFLARPYLKTKQNKTNPDTLHQKKSENKYLRKLFFLIAKIRESLYKFK
jgi:hypothetical protein